MVKEDLSIQAKLIEKEGQLNSAMDALFQGKIDRILNS
jgi:hypothetical protein